MNQHLTWDQISDFMIGDTQPRYVQHARECSACRSEIAKLEGALSEFRGAVRHWTERVSGIGLARAGVETSIVHLDFQRGMYAGNETRAGLTSLAIHAAMLALLLFLGSLKGVQKVVKEAVTLIAPAPPKPLKPEQVKSGGGGSPQQAKVEMPKPVPKRFVPQPLTQPHTQLIAPVQYEPSDNPLDTGATLDLGSVLAGVNLGGGGGIGNSKGAGIGSGTGPGSSGGSGGGTYKAGGDVSAPVPISRPEPQYSEEARKAKWGGTVLLSLIVDETGHTTDIKVLKPLGLGLDEKAIEAVSKWLFKPGMRGGKPVKVQAQIEVTFRLL